MKTADGNDKLGKGCIVVSRPVGDTCPSDCDYLNNGCYAEQTEKQYKNARTAGFANVVTEKNKIRAMILDAKRREKSIRWHERGDWFLNGELDLEYIANVTWACESILADGDSLPDMWFYTHIYDSRLVSLEKYMNVYASVHDDNDMGEALAQGFKLFAWCDSDMKIAPKRPKNKAKATHGGKRCQSWLFSMIQSLWYVQKSVVVVRLSLVQERKIVFRVTCVFVVWVMFCFLHTKRVIKMAKYYISCGSLQMIYSTSKNARDACKTVLWETNEHDVLDEYFYVDERGYRNYTSATPDTVVIRSDEILKAEGWM